MWTFCKGFQNIDTKLSLWSFGNFVFHVYGHAFKRPIDLEGDLQVVSN